MFLSRGIVSLVSSKCAPLNVIRSNSLFRSSQIACFNAAGSVSRQLLSTQSGREIRKKIQEEIDYETKSDQIQTTKKFIDEFIRKHPWQIEDIDGKGLVKFSKNQGSETITVFIDSSDINQRDEMDFDEDEEERMEEEEEEEEVDELSLVAVFENPSRSNAGAMVFELTTQTDEFLIDKVNHFPDVSKAHQFAKSKDTPSEYTGPCFSTLDPDLRELFNNFLEENKFDSSLCKFFNSYAMSKETREYINWLGRVKSFFKD